MQFRPRRWLRKRRAFGGCDSTSFAESARGFSALPTWPVSVVFRVTSESAPLTLKSTGLTHLTLHCKVYCDPTPISLPFRLQRLVIAGQYHPLALVHSIFAASSTTLVDLVTNLLAGQSLEERELIYRSIASLQRLQRLSDFGRNSDETMALLPHLPTSLEEFNTCLPDKHRVIQLANDLNLNRLPHMNRVT